MTMKFGLMYEIQIPEPHYDGIEQERYKQVMAQVELADEVGFQYFWTVEHHFLREFSHCSAPEVLYGALSQRTKRIRIGHAVTLLPGQYNHPVRVAERAAVLDIVSDGRMDLGTGRSTTLIEMDGFQVDPEETRAQWEEAVAMIPRMWTEDPFTHEGRFYRIPPRSVIPKPVQKPHPPLWVVVLLPLAHPIHIAEDIATLDHISRGRVEFGVGRGTFPDTRGRGDQRTRGPGSRSEIRQGLKSDLSTRARS
jgi:alkanesulfonate monooxygenase SsuD/methylene tetrahydromethanopterin reductase-like flavin-dependent oxidoreductase (luciferase family)